MDPGLPKQPDLPYRRGTGVVHITYSKKLQDNVEKKKIAREAERENQSVRGNSLVQRQQHTLSMGPELNPRDIQRRESTGRNGER